MGNINQNSHSNISLKVSLSDYWDFMISGEIEPSIILSGNTLYDSGLISYIDIDDIRCLSGDTLYSTVDYKWVNAYNSGLTLNNIGFTGIDNGIIKFDKNTITESEFINLVTGSTLEIVTGDTRLILRQVSGNTGNYVYPTTFETGETRDYIRLDGGFYQGFYQSNYGDVYSILPPIINSELTFDFVIKPDLTTTPLDKTLNSIHPDNKGFFFYIGTRAENKFWYDYLKSDSSYYSEISKTEQTTPISTSGLTLNTDDGFNIVLQNVHETPTDNKHIIFNRIESGTTAYNFDSTVEYSITGQTKNNINKYLDYNRTYTGYTTQAPINQTNETIGYNIADDIIKNCIGFRVKDNGSIGYRTITGSCVENQDFVVVEEYSQSGLISGDTWNSITVRMVFNSCFSEFGNENRTYKLMFYGGGKLLFVSQSLPELQFRKLNDLDTKQESVPFNISLGGGSQGLADMIGFNTGYTTQYLLPIEKYFGGSLIGSISKFRIYDGKLDYSKIKNNYDFEFNQTPTHTYLEPTIDFYLSGNTLTYPETDYFREIGNTSSSLNAFIQLNRVGVEPYTPLTGYRLYYYKDNGPQNQINGLFPVLQSGGQISEYLHNEQIVAAGGSSSIDYMIEVFDTVKVSTGTKKIKTINFDSMIFFGDTSGITTTETVRNLSGKLFNINTTEFILPTGIINKKFIIAIPTNRTLVSVVDRTQYLDINLTTRFINYQMDIEDAGGKLTPYNVYVSTQAIPYFNGSHNFYVIIS